MADPVADPGNGNDAGDRLPEGGVSAAEEDPMKLTDQERQWALAIKHAFEEDEDVLAKAISDMEIAACAIMDHDDTARSIERAQCMQAFRMNYNINDNVEEGCEFLRKDQELHPGCILAMEECSNDDGLGSHVAVTDISKFNAEKVLEDKRGFRQLLGQQYYYLLCLHPDIKSIREGFRILVECDGVSAKNISYNLEKKKFEDLLSHYPARWNQVKMLRQPSIVAILHSFLRPIIPREISDKYLYGHAELQEEYPDPIDGLYNQPTPEAAKARLMQKMKESLTKRFENQHSFRL